MVFKRWKPLSSKHNQPLLPPKRIACFGHRFDLYLAWRDSHKHKAARSVYVAAPSDMEGYEFDEHVFLHGFDWITPQRVRAYRLTPTKPGPYINGWYWAVTSSDVNDHVCRRCGRLPDLHPEMGGPINHPYINSSGRVLKYENGIWFEGGQPIIRQPVYFLLLNDEDLARLVAKRLDP